MGAFWHLAIRAALVLVAGAVLIERSVVASGEQFYVPSAGDFGGVGLLQTRTARFAPDGQLDVGVSEIDPYRRYYISLQALPWLEGTFRYSDLTKIALGGDTFKDRGADLKFKLWSEGEYWPAIAVGLQDGVGTGLFDGEYVVASKRFFDLDFSLGIGWGYLGTRGDIKNPLAFISSAFDNRDAKTGRGGKFSPGNYFSGARAALFGGVEYFTPIEGLTLKAEYEGNDYTNEPRARFGNKVVPSTSPFNFGLNYRPFSWLDIAAGHERGYAGVVRVSMRANLHTAGTPKFDPPPPPPVEPRQATTDAPTVGGDPMGIESRGVETDAAATALIDDLARAGLRVQSIELSGQLASVYVAGGIEGLAVPDLSRAARKVASVFGEAVESVAIVELGPSGPATEVSFTMAELAELEIVDYMVDGLERVGVEAFELSHTEATLYTESHLSLEQRTRVARVVMAAAPTALDRVVFLSRGTNGSLDREALSRGDVQRSAPVDEMFDRLEASGFFVESVNFANNAAVVTVSTEDHLGAADYRRAGWIIANSAASPVDEVTVIGLRDGREEARVTVLPEQQGTDAVSSGGATLDVAGIEIAESLFAELAAQGVQVDAVHFTRTRATVFVTPQRYPEAARNVGRPARVIANNAPSTSEEISVVTMAGGMPINHVTLMRRDLERAVVLEGSGEEIWSDVTLDGGTSIPESAVVPPGRYPAFTWSLTPNTRQYLGDSAQFLLYQIYVRLNGRLELMRGLSLTGTLFGNLYNNFEKASTASDSKLPRVRSEILKYLQGADHKLSRLGVNYAYSPRTDLYARVSAGIFEEMFGGVGAEVLYRPFGSRWAVGFDINRVRQRDFEGGFGFLDYEVTTGHANINYELPIYNLSAAMHIGQFLAGDRGASYFLWRRFESGVSAGVWATVTNVPEEVFGEGSFDKGFFIRIPFDIFLTRSTRRAGIFAFRPLSRDGGQILAGSKMLYAATQGGNLGELARDWDRLLD